MIGPGPDIGNLITLDHLNPRAMDLELRETESIITNENNGVGLRSVINPLKSSLIYSGEVNFRGEVNGQNLCGRQSPLSGLMYSGIGLVQNEISTVPKPVKESFTIGFIATINQILASFGNKPNANPREGFDISAACANAGRLTSSEWNKKQEDRIRTLEIQLNTVTDLWKDSQRSLAKLQEEVSGLSSKVLL